MSQMSGPHHSALLAAHALSDPAATVGGWVGPAAVAIGAALALIALARRGRATLLKRRRLRGGPAHR
jgi:hypothetical protein